MNDSPAPADRDESAQAERVGTQDLEILPPGEQVAAATALPPGVQPSRNYLRAVELGHVLASSGFYPDAKDPAKAAVKVMIGMDLGLSPTAALQAIHVIEDSQGKVSFLIEGKLLAALIKSRPGYDYRFTPVDPDDPSKGVIRGDDKVSIDFYRDGEKLEPSIEWTMERAQKAGLTGKKNQMYAKYPAEMLTWRALAEGTRIHFPELLAGNPVYADVEFGGDEDGDFREALAPAKAQPLDDEESEKQRAALREIFDELKAVNPERLLPPMFAGMVQRAEHSHERLATEIERLKDLLETEKTLAALKDKAREELPDPEAKALIDKAERAPSNRQRIGVMEAALGGEEGEGDGSAASSS